MFHNVLKFKSVSSSLQSMLNMRRSSATIFGKFLYLLKILVTISSQFYAYWRSWRHILPDFMPTEDLGEQFLPILCLLKILASQWWPIRSFFIPISKNYRSCYVQKKIMQALQGFASLETDKTKLIWNGMITWNAIRKLITTFWKKKKIVD